MIRYFIIFGASGDLTSSYLLPTLAQLRQEERVGADIQILGIAPEDWDTAFFQNYIRAKLKLHVRDVVEVWTNDLSSRLEYRKANVTKPEQVQAALASGSDAAVLYLALPPGVLLPALRSIRAARVPEGSRIVLEKPFGTDRQSARQGFSEKALFRMDHFLGKQTVQSILGSAISAPASAVKAGLDIPLNAGPWPSPSSRKCGRELSRPRQKCLAP
ncbi:MAG TPA: hypothetical protein VE616_08740 [Candidatus Udaeobacter sp.]|jgi:glucose-6-phosphate 1-dehydrogenase|nr:hypothetical protein [Candidatus Udaeobacter sp.]